MGLFVDAVIVAVVVIASSFSSSRCCCLLNQLPGVRAAATLGVVVVVLVFNEFA